MKLCEFRQMLYSDCKFYCRKSTQSCTELPHCYERVEQLNLSLCLSTTSWRCMEEWIIYLHAFLTSALDGTEWPALRPGNFDHRKRTADILSTGNWVIPRSGLVWRGEKSLLCPDRFHYTSC